MSTYDICSESFDSQTNLNGLLQCIADTHDDQRSLQEYEYVNDAELAAGVDAFFLLFAGALVYFMQTGFAMLCAGSIRTKNVRNVLLWNLLDSCGGGIAFWAVGWAFAYGGQDDGSGPKTFIGNTDFFLMNSLPRYEEWFFQFAFACALSSIVAGTVAERCKMTAYLFYSVFLVGFVYPVVAHAFWSTNGFLSNTTFEPLWGSGAIDLAGSGPVHMVGGVTALVAAIILGPRIGRFYDDDGNKLEEPNDIPPHSVTLQFLGTFALWFGWYGFNPGSVLKISGGNGQVAALAAVNTTLGACAGAVSAMFTSTILDYRNTGQYTYDPVYTCNGCLTGLVAITAGCATVEPWAAVVIGIIAGWLYLFGSHILVKCRIDDAVDAIPVHMFGGAWGVISTGLFTTGPLRLEAFGSDDHIGWFYEWARGSGDFTLIGIQLLSVLFIIGWTSFVMGVFFKILHLFGMLRLDRLEELVGMDLSHHKGSAYSSKDSPREQDIEELMNSRHGSSRSLGSKHEKKSDAKVDGVEQAKESA